MNVFLINFIDAKINESQYAALRAHPWALSDECRIDGKLFRVQSVDGEWVRVEYVETPGGGIE